MPTYKAKIGTADGRILEKEFDAVSSDLLRENLEGQGFFVFQIKKVPFQFLGALEKSSGRLTGRRFLSFNQELLVLIRSGLPILKVLDTMIEKMETGAMLDVLRDVREDVKGGSALSEALEKFPRQFPALFIASVKAGERTGDLPETLGRFIAYQRRVEEIRAKVRSASFYPIILTSFTVVVVTFLLLFVVPRFSQIYADAKVQLPLITRILVAVANSLTAALPLLLAVAIGGAFLFRMYARSEAGGLLIDRWRLRMPFFGSLQMYYSVANFSRTLSTVLASGIPVVPAMQMARGTLNNRELENRMAQATHRVEEGQAFSAALEEVDFFPVIALRMIGVGETTGALDEMLTEVSNYYESEVEAYLGRLTTMIEPLMMLFMGLLVGGIVVAMYVPIFQLAGTVS